MVLGGRSIFDPVGTLPWVSAWSADGDNMRAQGYSHGDAISVWPDEVGVNHWIAVSGNEPTLAASHSDMNLQTVVVPSANTIDMEMTIDVALAQSYSFVAVGHVTAAWITQKIFTGDWPSPQMVYQYGNRAIMIGAGATILGSATLLTQTGPYIMAGFWNGATSEIFYQHEIVKAGSVTSSVSVQNKLHLFPDAVVEPLCFLGLIENDVKDQANWPIFLNGSYAKWGIEIA